MASRRAFLQIATAALSALLLPQRANAAELPPDVASRLRESSLIYVATRRKSGTRSTIAPIWFYYEGGDELFFTTSPKSWKARRLRRGIARHARTMDRRKLRNARRSAS